MKIVFHQTALPLRHQRLTHAEVYILKFDKIYAKSNFITKDKNYFCHD